MLEFAEQEIYLPEDSPVPGLFSSETQPFARLFFDGIGSGQWSRTAVTGPSQTGKSLISYIIPCLYHLFEIVETVICATPDLAMANDKWMQDFLPAIQASRYRELVPVRGEGSRGGKIRDMVKFRNGATLRFMTGGGDDKNVAGFTSRVLLITEANGLGKLKASSNESDRIKQLRARLRSYGPNSIEYAECTEETDRDFIHQSYLNGSASRILLPCPHCNGWVTPEREHLVGWEDAEDELQAIDRAHLICPVCREPWTEEQRVEANRECKLIHKGQEINESGEIVGDLPRTRTLGFRWSAVNNMLNPIAAVGADEWHAARSIDEEAAERELRQFIWAIPTEPSDQEVVDLSVQAVCDRMSGVPREVVPSWADVLTLGVDCGQYLLHWVLLAGDSKGERHTQVVDYGIEEVHSRQLGVDPALASALGMVQSMADERGWPDEHGEARHPSLIFYDSGWKPVPVYRHCKQAGPHHVAVKGFGLNQYSGKKYNKPKTTGSITLGIYDGFHLAQIQNNDLGAVRLYEFDADRSKARVHDRLGVPMDEPGALLLPRVDRGVEHMSFAKHLLAEHLVEVDGVQQWMPTPGHGGHNHWLDSTGMANLAFIRRCTQPKRRPRGRKPVMTAPDGRPYLATQR